MRTRSLALLVFLVVTATCGLAWSQELDQVGVIISDASETETMLIVRLDQPILEERPIILESRDRLTKEVYQVVHVYEFHILLDRPLKNDYLSGSRIFQ